MLLIHGNSSARRTFERQLDNDFGRTHRVVAIDLPGFGDSQPVADPDAVMGQGEQEQLVNAAYFMALDMPTLWRHTVQGIAGAGHAPHWAQAAVFNDLLAAFVADCRSG